MYEHLALYQHLIKHFYARSWAILQLFVKLCGDSHSKIQTNPGTNMDALFYPENIMQTTTCWSTYTRNLCIIRYHKKRVKCYSDILTKERKYPVWKLITLLFNVSIFVLSEGKKIITALV